MKKSLKRVLATAAAGLLTFSAVSTFIPTFANAEESTESYKVFLAFGGDAAEENDWGLSYAGGEVSGDITATDGEIAVGETVKVGLTFAEPVVNAWYFAPTIIAENVIDADFSVKVFIDGEEVTADLTAGDNWWYEATGDYTDTQAVRVAGGYNEWGTQYISEPSGFTTLEYEITANSIEIGEAAAVNAVESEEEYNMFLAFGGDAAEENDWGLSYAGAEVSGDITATDATIKSGETATVKLEFANPVVNAWYFAPTIIAENVVEADFTVKVLIDGEEVTADLAAGDNWWYEATGDYSDTQAVRVAGGYNEWGTQYISEPSGFTTLEYEITANSIKVGTAAEEEVPTSSAGPVDLDGTYHAYVQVQGPKFTFRDAWDNASTGNGTDFFNQMTFQGDTVDKASVAATMNDVEITGNGTYTASITGIEWPEDEFAEQEYCNIIALSTDIPNTNEVTISDIVLKIDGNEVTMSPILSPDSIDYVNMLIQNIWNEDCKTIGYYATPFADIEITFTVSGFNYDNTAAADTAETADDAAASDNEVDASAEPEKKTNTGLIIGIIAAVVVVGGGVAIGAGVGKKKEDK